MNKIFLFLIPIFTLIFNSFIFAQDFNSMKIGVDTILIGKQVWMKKNLDVDHYLNGDQIPEVKDPKEWINLKTGAWCYYNNDPANGAIYGKLYNWFAVNDPRGLAHEGWHIPSIDEWDELTNFLGGKEIAGNKLKEDSSSHWDKWNTRSTNESGFTALPGGWRYYADGGFQWINGAGLWCSSTMYSDLNIRAVYMYSNYPSVEKNIYVKSFGFSVRCVKD